MVFFSNGKVVPSLLGRVILIGVFNLFCADLIIMKFIFLRFIDSLLISYQCLTLINSWLTVVSSSLGFLDEAKVLVSSANRRNESLHLKNL